MLVVSTVNTVCDVDIMPNVLSLAPSGLCTETVSTCWRLGRGNWEGMDVAGRLAGLSEDLGEFSPDDTPTLLAVKLFWSGTSCMSSGKGWAGISGAEVAKRSADVRVMALNARAASQS